MDLLTFIVSVCLLHCAIAEHTFQEDTGQCVPIYCEFRIPPEKCTSLCGLQKYVPICQEPANICLCQKLVNNRIQYVSPDEVEATTAKSKESKGSESEPSTFMAIFAFIQPLDNSKYSVEEPPSAVEDSYVIETVNVHDGRLFYAFTYILTGLFVLMICLIVYEIIMCKNMNNNFSLGHLDEKNKVTQI